VSTEREAREVVIDRVEAHPDADRLDIAHVGGYPCIVRRGEFTAGAVAVYVPVDVTVPTTRPEFAFLAAQAGADDRVRIRAMRLRGVLSMGLLLPACDITALDVRPWDPPWESSSDGQDAPPPRPEPPVYGVEGLRRWPNAFQAWGEPVVVTEKVHGSSGRAFVDVDGVFHVGSHTRWKDPGGSSEWAVVAREFDLAGRLARGIAAGECVFWECAGKVGGFPYGTQRGRWTLRVFDSIHVHSRTWRPWHETVALCTALGLPTVPVLYEGLYDAEVVRGLAEGRSAIDPSHVREGVVVRTAIERYDHTGPGRMVLKLHGAGFLTRKGA